MCENLKKYRRTAIAIAAVSFVVAVIFVAMASDQSNQASEILSDMTRFEFSTDYTSYEYQSALNMATGLNMAGYACAAVCGLSAICAIASGLLIAYRKDAAQDQVAKQED